MKGGKFFFCLGQICTVPRKCWKRHANILKTFFRLLLWNGSTSIFIEWLSAALVCTLKTVEAGSFSLFLPLQGKNSPVSKKANNKVSKFYILTHSFYGNFGELSVLVEALYYCLKMIVIPQGEKGFGHLEGMKNGLSQNHFLWSLVWIDSDPLNPSHPLSCFDHSWQK